MTAAYRQWNPGQPEGRYEDEDYVAMFFNWNLYSGGLYQNGGWEDVVGDNRFGDVVYGVAETETTVPEPATIIIWSLLGALAITVGRRRRRRA